MVDFFPKKFSVTKNWFVDHLTSAYRDTNFFQRQLSKIIREIFYWYSYKKEILTLLTRWASLTSVPKDVSKKPWVSVSNPTKYFEKRIVLLIFLVNKIKIILNKTTGVGRSSYRLAMPLLKFKFLILWRHLWVPPSAEM